MFSYAQMDFYVSHQHFMKSPYFFPFLFSLASLRLNHHGNHLAPSEEEAWGLSFSAPPILFKFHPVKLVVLRCYAVAYKKPS